VLTDSAAGEIIRNTIIPMLRVDRSNEAMIRGVDAVMARLQEKASRAPAPLTQTRIDYTVAIILGVAGMFGLIGLIVWYIQSSRRRERERALARQARPRVPVPPAARRVQPTETHREDTTTSSRSTYEPSPAPSYSPPSYDSGGSSFGGFGGGDSGGGGASGSY
jgi:uncharacterized membrane protein YgcG